MLLLGFLSREIGMLSLRFENRLFLNCDLFASQSLDLGQEYLVVPLKIV